MNKQEFDMVRRLAAFLEKYIPVAQNTKVGKAFDFSQDDKIEWNVYFEKLILTGVLQDGEAFGAPNNDTNVGVGRDGSC